MIHRQRYCSNPNDISTEHIIQRWSNGIKLVDPEYCRSEQISSETVCDILNKRFNVYFMNLESQLKEVNEQTVINCGYQSIPDALGRTARDVANKRSAEQLILNDRQVIKFDKPEITDDTFDGMNEEVFDSLTMKFPWYGQRNEIIGVFGCSIILGRHSLADSLEHITKLGLLSHTLPGMEIENAYLSKREQECLYHYVRGKSAREISHILPLSKRTIEHYLENVKLKLNVSKKSELIDKVIRYF